MLLLPFPQRFQKAKLDKQFEKFLEVLKSLHVTIPFTNAIAQMLSYAKILKEILFNKKKLEEFETLALTEESNAILQNKLPPKLKDPGKFFTPVDFVGLDMEEEVHILIILGRPFLATVGAMIDVKNGRLTLEVGKEKVEFNLF
ncbi:uncharacterized protein LOC131181346 [Hevea brasiliensis]|uniref:uncharacterized protein LOC131181346 n=1 Tax=Hevea brasiliensis TaxID=3981 RepID=UPI0025CD32AB|nr:uncharacterized protein LOC131181346 [Hevea brasiliensis]